MSKTYILQVILLGLTVALPAAAMPAQNSPGTMQTWAANSGSGDLSAGPTAASIPASPAPAPSGKGSITFFAGYSFLDSGQFIGLNNHNCSQCAGPEREGVNGWEFSGTLMLNKTFGITLDYSGHNTTGCETCAADIDQDDQFFLGGLTVVKPIGSRLKLVGQGLVGISLAGARAELGGDNESEFCPTSECPFIPHNIGPAFAIGGGADYMLSRHWGIRIVQIDYLWSHMDRGVGTTERASVNDLRISTGLLFRIGVPK